MTTTNSKHRCPIGDCPAEVPSDRLMCPMHWQLVPPRLKRELRATWRGGEGAGSRPHRKAIRACIEAVTAACQPASDQNLRRMVRRFLAAYRHPNHVNGEAWDEEDVSRVIRVMRCHPHRPDPGTHRCRRCGATVAT